MFTRMDSERAEFVLTFQTGGSLPSTVYNADWYSAEGDALLAVVFHSEAAGAWCYVVLARGNDLRYRLASGRSGFKTPAQAEAALDALATDELLADVRAACQPAEITETSVEACTYDA